jgi:putative hemolysin
MYDNSYYLSDTQVEEPEVEYGLCVMPKTWVKSQETWKDVDAKVYEKLGVQSYTSERYTICFPKVAAKMKAAYLELEDERGRVYREDQEPREIMGNTSDFRCDAYVTDGYASCMLKYCYGGRVIYDEFNSCLLSGFCVLPQGENHGTRFMGHIKEYLVARKEKRLYLFTDSDCDPRVDDFYARRCSFTQMMNYQQYFTALTKYEEARSDHGEEYAKRTGFKQLPVEVEDEWQEYEDSKLYFVQLEEV